MVRGEVSNFVVEFAMRVDKTETLAVAEVTAHQPLQKLGLAGAGGANDVHVGFALLWREEYFFAARVESDKESAHRHSLIASRILCFAWKYILVVWLICSWISAVHSGRGLPSEI